MHVVKDGFLCNFITEVCVQLQFKKYCSSRFVLENTLLSRDDKAFKGNKHQKRLMENSNGIISWCEEPEKDSGSRPEKGQIDWIPTDTKGSKLSAVPTLCHKNTENIIISI